jgi:hypothetical protein
MYEHIHPPVSQFEYSLGLGLGDKFAFETIRENTLCGRELFVEPA